MLDTGTPTKHKTTRLNIRINEYQKEIIAKAAQIKHTTLSNFVLENAYEAAHEILVQQQHFSLSDEQWDDFCDALDTPPREITNLKNLFSE